MQLVELVAWWKQNRAKVRFCLGSPETDMTSLRHSLQHLFVCFYYDDVSADGSVPDLFGVRVLNFDQTHVVIDPQVFKRVKGQSEPRTEVR